MYDYGNTIRLIMQDLETRIEDDIINVVQNYGIEVDREELIKALEYDRKQYEKGYADAMVKEKRGKWMPFDEPWYQCSECGAVREQKSFMENYCPNCGARMENE